MAPRSAGILLYRKAIAGLEVLLVHPGGPYYAKRDTGVWSIPKGIYDEGEDPLEAAKREFKEELGTEVPGNDFIQLQPVRQKGGKTVFAWAAAGDLDANHITSNTFPMEYPYKSGRWIEVAEVDKAGWFSISEAMEKINPAQQAFLKELADRLGNK